jgi:GNAT superfamily N-acetyltransferase
MIRRAVPADKARVITLMRHFHADALLHSFLGGFRFEADPAYGERLFKAHLLWPHALCLVLDEDGAAQGVLMATATEHPFGPVRLARETLWWIEPDYRGASAVRMLDAFEEWARDQRCAFSGMAGLGGDPAVAKLYLRRGYSPAETHYLKAL